MRYVIRYPLTAIKGRIFYGYLTRMGRHRWNMNVYFQGTMRLRPDTMRALGDLDHAQRFKTESEARQYIPILYENHCQVVRYYREREDKALRMILAEIE